MSSRTTVEAVEGITDPGLFERLATAVLRRADILYRALAHTGVNAEGKPVKAPVDGICFELRADPPHMILVHHTITARDALREKWLHDPATVKPRKGAASASPPGDLVKTAALVADERRRRPFLRATLALTTNAEPSVDLIREVVQAGGEHGIEGDLWTRSRLCDFLDNEPDGQWIRRSLLGIEQQRLSVELFRELSATSLRIHAPPDNPEAWIPRTLDRALAASDRRGVTFFVGGSGVGKSVACYRWLRQHVNAGGLGLVVAHDVVAAATTLEQAVMMTLQRLHPPLDTSGVAALSFVSPDWPMLLTIEDINKSGQASALAEKLVGWSRGRSKAESSGPSAWRLVCPVWPEVLAALSEQALTSVASLITPAGSFVGDEGRDAVVARAVSERRAVSASDAQAIARALGDDPLLISLHHLSTMPEPHRVIRDFIEHSLARAEATGNYAASDYRGALRLLGEAMLSRRRLEVAWADITGWVSLQGDPLRMLADLARRRELIRLDGPSDRQSLAFRHDRVRDWLLADAAASLERNGDLADEIVAEPFFAELMGSVLAWGEPTAAFLPRVAAANPLALFHAFSLTSPDRTGDTGEVLRAIHAWLDVSGAQLAANEQLRWDALTVLAETNSVEVRRIVERMGDRTWASQFARLRNGDLTGGLELCIAMDPSVGAPWRDVQIEHAKLHHGPALRAALNSFLRQENLDSTARVGALRLAGHFAHPELADSIEACWAIDPARDELLDDYLWAAAQCCGNNPARYLGPVCDAWASLSDEPGNSGMSSPRNSVAVHHPRWAFRRWPPSAAIAYFIQRAASDDLRWPITYMLHGVDHPEAVAFVVRELAMIARRVEEAGSFSPFVRQCPDAWTRAQDDEGRPMSRASRDPLLALWREEPQDRFLRRHAFSIWSATTLPDDIEILQAVRDTDDLADHVLFQRLARGDDGAIPRLIAKLADTDGAYWWQAGRHVWSPELTESLDAFLDRRGTRSKRLWSEEVESDWITSELVMNLPALDAERLLVRHWEHLRYSSYFVAAALYIGTPRLLDAAEATIHECPTPAQLFQFLHWNFGIRMQGRAGLIREQQVRDLVPYFSLMSPQTIGDLWDGCNQRGWFGLRRELLDGLLDPAHSRRLWTRPTAKQELDEMASQQRSYFMEHWVDDYLKTDVQWREVLETLSEWLEERRSLDALRLVSAAIRSRGSRADLTVLHTYEGAPEPAYSSLIADTRYAVHRRSIR